jgi:hypothetical protein
MRKLEALFLTGILASLAGCGGGNGGGSDPADAGAGGEATITVTGKVLDALTGGPAAFLPVMVAGKVTASDANGNFTMTGVTSPYQLVVLQPTMMDAQVFEGVTRKDPIVLVYQSPSSTPKKASLVVNFGGTGTGDGLMDFSNPVNANGGVTGSVATPGTSYSQDIQWIGPSSFDGNVCAILYQDVNGVATAINAFGEEDRVSLQDGQTTTVGVNMAAVQSKAISGTVTVPTGFTLSYKILGFVCGGNAQRPSYPFTFDTSSGTSFNYPTPVTPNALYMGASAQKGEAYLVVQQFGVPPDASGITLALPPAIEQTSPADNALGIAPSTSFSWSPTTVGLSQVSIWPVSPGPLRLTIFTPNATVALPDLSALGYPLVKGVTYSWAITADSTVQTLDDALSGVPRDDLKSYTETGSGSWKFTTAP